LGRPRRYCAEMIYLQLRQEGLLVNHKRDDHPCAEASLQIKRRRPKEVPVGKRQPRFRPGQDGQVCSMKFVFDRSADDRVVKCLTVVDNVTQEAVAFLAERAISGELPTRTMERICKQSRHPKIIKIIRTDDGKEFCGRAMMSLCHAHGGQLRLIKPSKPNQNAYVE